MIVPPVSPGRGTACRGRFDSVAGDCAERIGAYHRGTEVDIYCPRCGEPWGIDELHDAETVDGVPMTFAEARKLFFAEGCSAVFGYGRDCAPADDAMRFRGGVSGMLADLLGHDVDGIAAEMEDFEYLGMFR